MTEPLANQPGELAGDYETVVVGSGYGGAVTAARLAERGRPVCVLERGKEWIPGTFPDTASELRKNLRGKTCPLGLFDYYLCEDIDVLKGNGLGGTSLVNANTALRPDPELFAHQGPGGRPRWPKLYRDLAGSGELWKYYERAESMLAVGHHPKALELAKVQLLKKRADQLTDHEFGPVNIAVNFKFDGPNDVGVAQKPCIGCNDCITGCNVRAKNTLYMNYLPYAKAHGAQIFTQIEVRSLTASPGGGYTVVYRRNEADKFGEERTLRARKVVLSAGTLGSTEILLRSAQGGFAASPRLGHGFSGNGDFLGLAYNGDHRANVLGFGNHLDSPRAKVRPGPTIVAAIRYNRSRPFAERLTVQDFSALPSGLVDLFRRALPVLAVTSGKGTRWGIQEVLAKVGRVGRDLLHWDPEGAANHSMVYLVMCIDDGAGTMTLGGDDKLKIGWPTLRKDPSFDRVRAELLEHARMLDATYVHLGRFNPLKLSDNLVTAHPLGGCHLAEDSDSGVVDVDGRVFDGQGGVHPGLFVVDGAIVPMAEAVNPFITISALAERIAEKMA
ncbi:MAG TPA: GMC family oxidoreductase [Thermoanaerobaculia bacterium]|nr:GMC family oxidoreductase [Thermoanaerobaculia bacterium]